MTTRHARRRVGRPGRAELGLSADAVLDAAQALLREGGIAAVTLRAIAERLGADAMAPYHYFAGKDAILVALAERIYAGFEVRLPRAGHRARLRRLATAYVALLVDELGELTPYLAEASQRSAARRRAAEHAFVDFLHGFALARRAGDPATRRALHAELAVIVAGIEAFAAGRA